MKGKAPYALAGALAVVAALGWLIAREPVQACAAGVMDRGNGWLEIGGPIAFLSYDPPYFSASQARMAWVRIAAPTDGRSLTVDVWERGGSGTGRGTIQPAGRPISDFEPAGRPISDLPGRMHFFTLDIPSAGCWTLDFRLGDERAGSATIPVVPLPAH